MMRTRALPREQWDERLQGTELEVAHAFLPAGSTVLVVEDDEDGTLLACWSLMPCWHAEGVWVAPSHRGRGGVARRILRAMMFAAKQVGAESLFTSALTDDVATIISNLEGRELEGRHFVIPVRKV